MSPLYFIDVYLTEGQIHHTRCGSSFQKITYIAQILVV